MAGKYIITVGTINGEEVCVLSPKRQVDTLDKVRKFRDEYSKEFPHHSYKIYNLREIRDDK